MIIVPGELCMTINYALAINHYLKQYRGGKQVAIVFIKSECQRAHWKLWRHRVVEVVDYSRIRFVMMNEKTDL